MVIYKVGQQKAVACRQELVDIVWGSEGVFLTKYNLKKTSAAKLTCLFLRMCPHYCTTTLCLTLNWLLNFETFHKIALAFTWCKKGIWSDRISSRVLPYLGMVGRYRGDVPRFWDFQSHWVPILYTNTIQLTTSFSRKNRFVCMTFSSKHTRT